MPSNSFSSHVIKYHHLTRVYIRILVLHFSLSMESEDTFLVVVVNEFALVNLMSPDVS